MSYQQYSQQNSQQNNIYGGNDTGGTPIELLRQDLKPQNNRDDETHYSVGSIDTTTDIRNLVNEINTNIETKSDKKKSSNKDDDTETTKSSKLNDIEKSIKNKKSKNKKIKNNKKYKKISIKNNSVKKNMCNTWEDYLYDFILLFIIFMLMSQEFVKNFIGSKIKMINVNDKGVVPFFGVVVYGFIFVTVFICMKILINKAIDFSL